VIFNEPDKMEVNSSLIYGMVFNIWCPKKSLQNVLLHLYNVLLHLYNYDESQNLSLYLYDYDESKVIVYDEIEVKES